MNDVHVLLWGGDAALALLLKAVQDKHRLGKPHGVDSAVGAAGIVFHRLQHPGAAKALEHLGHVMLVASLGQRQGIAEETPPVHGQGHQVLVAAPYPLQRFFFWHFGNIYEKVYPAKPPLRACRI